VSFVWRAAAPIDDDAIVSMSLSLSAEDPGSLPLTENRVRRALAKLRKEPARGRIIVCEIEGRIGGYCLMIPYWSNELGGEVCIIDELFVGPQYRSRGVATTLFQRLFDGDASLWPDKPVALALEVSFDNQRARVLYERLGFGGKNLAMRRLLPT
jgi:GNAT superfamily N-acetyltransferase